MREKTYYSSQPQEIEIERSGEKIHVWFRENVAKIILENDLDGPVVQYSADEYYIETNYSPIVIQKIFEEKEVWINQAKKMDSDKAAQIIREKRNMLLDESDKEMCLDRLGVERPTGSSFGDWLAFLQRLSSVMFGEMAKYRQELRDITKQEGFPYDVKFPEKPKTK